MVILWQLVPLKWAAADQHVTWRVEQMHYMLRQSVLSAAVRGPTQFY